MIAIETALERAGAGAFQWRLLGIFGLVWAADAMQVLAVGFTAPSIAQSFGITLPEALQTGTLFFLGMLLGAYFFGRLADRFGRRRVLIVTVACDAVFGLLSVFSPSYELLLVLRFLTGLAVGGTLPVDYAMMAEFLPARNRGRWLVGLEGFWAIGTIAVALAAWAAASSGVEDPWRWTFAATAIPALIGIWLRLWVPESPLYLLRNGKAEAARNVLNQILAVNGRPTLEPRDVVSLGAPEARSEGLFSPQLRRRTLLILTAWFLVSVSYYGIFTWMPARLAGEGLGFIRGYDFLVWMALAQVPGYGLAAYGVEKWGRRTTLVGFALLSAAGCALFTGAGSSAVIVGGSILVMSFALLGTWGALYAFTPELYPTTLRATGMGAAGAMARLGGLLAPSAVTLLAAQNFTAAVGLFAVLLLLAALASLGIGVETRQQVLS